MCTKRKYFTKSQAEQILYKVMFRNWRGNVNRKECRCYQCDECGYWHLTSMEAACI